MDWPIDFDHGMRFSSAYRQPLEPERWALIKKRYQDFLARPRETNEIPRILHQIWLGSELPEHYRAFIEKLRAIHPQWEYKLWTDDNIDFPLRNRSLFDSRKNMGEKSDILRYEILNRFGGVYLDLDFVALKPFDALLHADFFAGVTYDRKPQLANGLIGCAPNHSLSEVLCKFGDEYSAGGQLSIMGKTGPDYFTSMAFSHWPERASSVILPNTSFYPFPNFPRDRTLGPDFSSYLAPESFCCHLWHCSWLKKKNKPSGFLTRLKRLIHA